MRPRTIAAVTLVTGLLSLVVFVFERLALTDIFHGEPDTTLEWTVVNAAFLPIVGFHLWAVVGAGLSLRRR